MKIQVFLFIAVCWIWIGNSRLGAASANVIPKDQQALIEGLCYSAMLRPAVKETWPDLRSFNITSVTGDNVGAFTKTEAVVGPGQCTVTVEVRTRQRGSATLTLIFEAEAGRKYVLRPVYRGSVIAATIQNSDTGEFGAKTWSSGKKKKAPPSETLLVRPDGPAPNKTGVFAFRRSA